MSRKKVKDQYEPDPDKICEYSFSVRKSETKTELIFCEKLADYRVLLALGTKKMVEGGDASNPKDWESELVIQYYCRKHFDIVYKYSPPPTPKMTYVKIVRQSSQKRD